MAGAARPFDVFRRVYFRVGGSAHFSVLIPVGELEFPPVSFPAADFTASAVASSVFPGAAGSLADFLIDRFGSLVFSHSNSGLPHGGGTQGCPIEL